MVRSIKDIGLMGKRMAKDLGPISTVRAMWESGERTKPMVEAFMCGQQEISMRESGLIS